jgi:hypothetical protein
MELIPGSKTSTHLIQTPGIYPEDNTLQFSRVFNYITKIISGFNNNNNNNNLSSDSVRIYGDYHPVKTEVIYSCGTLCFLSGLFL